MAGERAVSLGKGNDFSLVGREEPCSWQRGAGGWVAGSHLPLVCACFLFTAWQFFFFFQPAAFPVKISIFWGGLTAGLGSGRKVKLRPRRHEVGEDPYDAFQKQRITRQLAGCNCWLLRVRFRAFSLGFGLEFLWEAAWWLWRAAHFNPELATAQEGLVGTCGGMKGLNKGSSFS